MAIPMTAAVEGAAGMLTPETFERDIVDLTMQNPVIGYIPPVIPADNKWIMEQEVDDIPEWVTGIVGGWVGEGEVKAKSDMEFSYGQLSGKEYAVMVPVSHKLLRLSTVPMEPLIAKGAARNFAASLDQAILGLGTPAAWGAAGSFKLAAEASGHVIDPSDYSDLAGFFSAMMAELEDNDNYNEARSTSSQSR